MDPTPANPDSRPLVYAGRFADAVEAAGLPEGCAVLGDWDVLPAHLADASARATAVVVVDPFSFPFEAMTGGLGDLPLVVALPRGFDADFLAEVFGKPVFARLGFFDRVATEDPALWEKLRPRYRWVESQRVALKDAAPGEAAREVCDRLAAEAAAPFEESPFEEGPHETARYWKDRGAALAARDPRRTVLLGAGRDPAAGKAVHRVQAAAIEPQFVAARGGRADDVPFEALEVGVGVGRWAAAFDPQTTRFSGVDVSEDALEVARADFPAGRFDLVGEDLRLPHADEGFDLVFTVGVMHHNPPPARLTLLSEMWRVARPGGRLLFLEDFVAEGAPEQTGIYPLSAPKFVEAVLAATGGQVVLEYVEALRYPRDPFFRGGLISLTKLGVPKTW